MCYINNLYITYIDTGKIYFKIPSQIYIYRYMCYINNLYITYIDTFVIFLLKKSISLCE